MSLFFQSSHYRPQPHRDISEALQNEQGETSLRLRRMMNQSTTNLEISEPFLGFGENDEREDASSNLGNIMIVHRI